MALPAAVITGLFGLGSSLLKGIGSSAKQRRLRKDWERRLSMLKPSTPYSGGRDPVVQAAIENMFLSRGMANPYASMGTGSRASAPAGSRASLGGRQILKHLAR